MELHVSEAESLAPPAGGRGAQEDDELRSVAQLKMLHSLARRMTGRLCFRSPFGENCPSIRGRRSTHWSSASARASPVEWPRSDIPTIRLTPPTTRTP